MQDAEQIQSQIRRERLARRAKERRIAMRLTMAETAHLMGIDKSRFVVWETRLIKKPKHESERRWEQVLQVPLGWLRDESLPTPAADHSTAFRLEAATTAAEEIELLACWLSVSKLRHRTTNKNLLTNGQQRNAVIFALRYGVGGPNKTTLEAIGQSYGLTRERVRQITNTMLDRMLSVDITTPQIDTVLNKLQNRLPSTVSTADRQLKEQLGQRLSVVDLSRFCVEVLGRSVCRITACKYGPMGHQKTVLCLSNKTDNQIERRFTAVRRMAAAMIRTLGAAHLSTVCGEAAGRINVGLTPIECLAYCEALPGFEWLSIETGWFWFGPQVSKKNRLTNATNKMLSVAKHRLDIDTIYSGFLQTRRHISQVPEQRRLFIEPPKDIVAAVLRRNPRLRTTQYDDFELLQSLDRSTQLSVTELRVIERMEQHGGVITRTELLGLEIDGVNILPMTLQATLLKSPLFAKIEPGIYRIRGAELSHDALARARQGRHHVRSDHQRPAPNASLSGEGLLHFDSKLGVGSVQNKYVMVPTFVARQMSDGEYYLVNNDSVISVQTQPSGATNIRGLIQALGSAITLGATIHIDVNPYRREVAYRYNSE